MLNSDSELSSLPIVKYAKSLGKTTSQLTFGDMMNFMRWMAENSPKGTKEVIKSDTKKIPMVAVGLSVLYGGKRIEKKGGEK